MRFAGAKTCKGGPCPIHPARSNLHAVWDGALIRATTWDWGAYVDRLEGGYLKSVDASALPSGGRPAVMDESVGQQFAHRNLRIVA